VAGSYGSPSGAIVVSRAAGCHSDVGTLSQCRVHTSGAALQHCSNNRAAFGGSSAELVATFGSSPAAELYTYPDAIGE
jgi:hypothetical protein